MIKLILLRITKIIIFISKNNYYFEIYNNKYRYKIKMKIKIMKYYTYKVVRDVNLFKNDGKEPESLFFDNSLLDKIIHFHNNFIIIKIN